ncbi:bifunctional riboflavin kinase/FAD synthetase [Waddlia chondrophila]|uniref:Riboflavin biosynthesis protein n=1 Tax=Waddlia chondrophila (strain ATCC VR-1470 / WSU 86-1044) TaxID=716544 RepID=D6YVR0_WADCW|nr:bifunctional riboflavin kinase/FAD synthetase [Waddlia chondrophila]ADI38221.1 putative riboflavin kinase/FMN adenylyltransferase [Waddlia chondrophila WSU 86-1044]
MIGIYQKIEDFKPLDVPVVLTIGNFDGVHRGHHRVIEQSVSYARLIGGKSVVLTFSNHPSEVLPNRTPVLPICTPLHKKQLLEKLSVDFLIQIPFSLEFSKQSAETFIQSIRKFIPFSHLVLGYDARFGNNRQGDQEAIQQQAKIFGFTTDYIDCVDINGITVSSSNIRIAVKNGNFTEASKLLERPYSILSTVIKGEQIGTQIGFPTANLDVANLCLPPFGVYAVHLKCDQATLPGVANLGVAPTLKNTRLPTFEVFMLDGILNLLGKTVELIPLHFLRTEVKFSSLKQLKQQISEDIKTAKIFFKHSKKDKDELLG